MVRKCCFGFRPMWKWYPGLNTYKQVWVPNSHFLLAKPLIFLPHLPSSRSNKYLVRPGTPPDAQIHDAANTHSSNRPSSYSPDAWYGASKRTASSRAARNAHLIQRTKKTKANKQHFLYLCISLLPSSFFIILHSLDIKRMSAFSMYQKIYTLLVCKLP